FAYFEKTPFATLQGLPFSQNFAKGFFSAPSVAKKDAKVVFLHDFFCAYAMQKKQKNFTRSSS
ncbi:hypothetical protein ACNGB5_09445, partial [Campylobacter jejuni]